MSQFKKYLEIIQEFKESKSKGSFSTMAMPDGIYPQVDKITEHDTYDYQYTTVTRKKVSDVRTNLSAAINIKYILKNINNFISIKDEKTIKILDNSFNPQNYLSDLYNIFNNFIFKNFIKNEIKQEMLHSSNFSNNHIDYVAGNKHEFYFIPLKQEDKNQPNTLIIRKKINKENM